MTKANPKPLVEVDGACDRQGRFHFEVISPEIAWGNGYTEPREYECCWVLVAALNAREARSLALRTEEMRPWVREARSNQQTPYGGLEAKLALCEHGACWACYPPDGTVGCELCAAEDDDRERLAEG